MATLAFFVLLAVAAIAPAAAPKASADKPETGRIGFQKCTILTLVNARGGLDNAL